jgi:phenylpropionate dioxygenase-like ring-hydroxylating dioxygenase large terminal subunit
MISWPAELRKKWFVVERGDHITTKPVAAVLLGRPIVLARVDGKRVVGYEDRCPHRQVPLSAGQIVNGTLQCAYHGWRFDPSGALVGLPGAPTESCLPNVRARVIEVIESAGLVWARLEYDGEIGIPQAIQDLPDESRRFLWKSTWEAGAADILENVLDPLHTHFIHRGLIRVPSARCDTLAVFSLTPDGFTVDYKGNVRQSGLIYRLFESPREFERSHFFDPGSIQLDYGYRNGSRVRISIHVSPESEHRSTIFGTLHVDGRWAPAWAVRLFVWPLIRKVANQDRDILSLRSANLRRFPDKKDIITPYDLVRRKILAKWDSDFARANNDAANGETLLKL